MPTDVSNSNLLLGIGTDALESPMKLQKKQRVASDSCRRYHTACLDNYLEINTKGCEPVFMCHVNSPQGVEVSDLRHEMKEKNHFTSNY